MPKRRGVGGIALHADGGLVISGKNICHVKDGTTRILFARDDAPGFNDLFTDSQGRIYTGTMKSDPFKLEGERVAGECWRIEGAEKATQLYGGVSLTNGIGFSPDGRTIYHCDTAQACVLVHESTRPAARHPGRPSVSTAALMASPSTPREGSDRPLPGGRRAAVPARWQARPASRGARACSDQPLLRRRDLRDLYVVSADNTDDRQRRGSVFRTRSDIPGLPAPFARI